MNPKKVFMITMTLAIATLVISLVPTFAQVDTAWVRRYGGPQLCNDWCNDIAVDDSGYVYVTGAKDYIQKYWVYPDYVTIKYCTDGDTAWLRTYGDPDIDGDWEEAHAIALDNSGNVYVTGEIDGDYGTIKYLPNGDEGYPWIYNGPGDWLDVARDIAVDDSGYVYVTGESDDFGGPGWQSDYLTIKYHPNGNVADGWPRRYNGPGNGGDCAYAIAVDDSGYVYVTGGSYGGTGTYMDYATIKYHPNGDSVWVRRFNGPANLGDEAYAIAVDDSGYVYVTGMATSNGTRQDYVTIKYRPNGDIRWQSTYDGPGTSPLQYTEDIARAIAVDDSGYVYVTGESWGDGTRHDYATIKYKPNGDTAWVRRYNGPGNSGDEARAIAVDDSGNVYVTGGSYGSGTSKDYATIKYYPNGSTAWEIRYDYGSYDNASAIAVDDSGNVYVTGGSSDPDVGDYSDCATIKYISTLRCAIPVSLLDPPSFTTPPIKVSPSGSRVIALDVKGAYTRTTDYEITTDHPRVTCIGNCSGTLDPGETKTVSLQISCLGEEFVNANIMVHGCIGTDGDTTIEIPVYAVCSDDYYECDRDPATDIDTLNSELKFWTCVNTEEMVWDRRITDEEKKQVIFSGGVVVATTADTDTVVGRQDFRDIFTGARDTINVFEGSMEPFFPDEKCVIQKVHVINTYIWTPHLAPPNDFNWWWIYIHKQIIILYDLPGHTCPEWKKEQIIKYVWIDYGEPPGWWPDPGTYTGHEDIYLGVFVDINAPFDDGCYGCNTAGYDYAREMIWQHGYSDGTHPEYEDHYVGLALTDPSGAVVAPIGAQNVLNDDYLNQQQGWGWLDSELYELVATQSVNIHYPDSVADRTVVLTAGVIPAGSDPGLIDLEFILIEAFIPGDPGTGLQELEAHIDSTRNILIPELDALGLFSKNFPICGDANNDGIVDAADIVYLLNHLYVPLPGLPPISWPETRADVNGDGIIDGADLVMLLNYLYVPPPGIPPLVCPGFGR